MLPHPRRATRIVNQPFGAGFAILESSAPLGEKTVVPHMKEGASEFGGSSNGAVGSTGF